MAKIKTKVKKSFRDRLDATLSTITDKTVKIGFSKIDLWVSAGNFAMNRRWSGRFKEAYLYGRQYIFYGESGSGKSLMCAIAAGNAQKENEAFVAWFDVEHATNDEAGKLWLQRAGVDIARDNFEYFTTPTLAGIKDTVTKLIFNMREDIEAGENPRPLVIVIDSWAAALTEAQWERTGGKKAGELVGDQGQKAKQTGDVILSFTHLCSGLPVLILGVQHIMDNQDGYGRQHKTTGGNKMIYYASGCMLLTKTELKDVDVKNAEVIEHYKTIASNYTAEMKKKLEKKTFVGITSKMEVLKSRLGKPFEFVEIQIPWLTGLDPYSGLFEVLVQEGVVTMPSQGWFQYMKDGSPVKFQKNSFMEHADTIMALAPYDIGLAATAKVTAGASDEEPVEVEETVDE